MFYSHYIFVKKNPLSSLWIAAHWKRKLNKSLITQTDISKSAQAIEQPTVPLALRLSGQLLLGLVTIYDKKVRYLQEDCSEAVTKMKVLLRKGFNPADPSKAPVDLPLESVMANAASITMAENYVNLDMPDQLEDLFGQSSAELMKLIKEARFGEGEEVDEDGEEKENGEFSLSQLSRSASIANEADISMSQESGMLRGSQKDIELEAAMDDGGLALDDQPLDLDDFAVIPAGGDEFGVDFEGFDDGGASIDVESLRRTAASQLMNESSRSIQLEAGRAAADVDRRSLASESINLSPRKSLASIGAADSSQLEADLASIAGDDEIPDSESQAYIEGTQQVAANLEAQRIAREQKKRERAEKQQKAATTNRAGRNALILARQNAKKRHAPELRDSDVTLPSDFMKRNLEDQSDLVIDRTSQRSRLVNKANKRAKVNEELRDQETLESLMQQPATGASTADLHSAMFHFQSAGDLGAFNPRAVELVRARNTVPINPSSAASVASRRRQDDDNKSVAGSVLDSSVASMGGADVDLPASVLDEMAVEFPAENEMDFNPEALDFGADASFDANSSFQDPERGSVRAPDVESLADEDKEAILAADRASFGAVHEFFGEEADEEPEIDQSMPGSSSHDYSKRTRKMIEFLQKVFKPLPANKKKANFSSIITPRADKVPNRAIAAGVFYQLLVLSNHGLVDCRQSAPFEEIEVNATKKFPQGQVAA